MRNPRDQSPEDGTMPGQSLGMHSLVPVVPVPGVQPLEQKQPFKNPNEMPIKAYTSSLYPPHPRVALAFKGHAAVPPPWLSSYHLWLKECTFSHVPGHRPCSCRCKGYSLCAVIIPFHPSWLSSHVTSTRKPSDHTNLSISDFLWPLALI